MADRTSDGKLALKQMVWVPVVVAVLTLALGLVLSEVKARVGWLPFLIAIALCLGIFVLCFHLFTAKVLPLSIGLMNELRAEIGRHLDKNTLTWLITSAQMAEFESTIECDDIWLVTCDLAEDIPGELFFDTVRSNLRKGTRYKYFIPRSLHAAARIKQILENQQPHGDVEAVPLSDDFFFLATRLDFAIYDPFNQHGSRCGYMGLPSDSNERYHCRMQAEFVDMLIGKLTSILDTQPRPAAANS